MSDDQMILDLVGKHGFTLPPMLEPLTSDYTDSATWALNEDQAYAKVGGEAGRFIIVEGQAAYDLCAAEFARQACGKGIWSYELSAALCAGDSPAAIEALWEALQ